MWSIAYITFYAAKLITYFDFYILGICFALDIAGWLIKPALQGIGEAIYRRIKK